MKSLLIGSLLLVTAGFVLADDGKVHRAQPTTASTNDSAPSNAAPAAANAPSGRPVGNSPRAPLVGNRYRPGILPNQALYPIGRLPSVARRVPSENEAKHDPRSAGRVRSGGRDAADDIIATIPATRQPGVRGNNS
ncbi:MAG: hypothetical protein ABI839_07795, partial [Verrucomicrobiota bacterium]